MRALGFRANDNGSPEALTGALLCIAYVLTLWASLALLGRGAVPPFWPCNAFIAVMVLLLERRLLLVCVVFCTLCSLPLMTLSSRGWDVGAIRVVFNVGEGILVGWLARRALGPRRLLRTAAGFLRLQLLAVLPPVLLNLILRESFLRLTGDPAAALTWRASCPICWAWPPCFRPCCCCCNPPCRS
jgi:hypothetical protein